jgi:hypothetical protein
MSAALGLEVVLEAVVDQRGDRRIRLEDDIAAAAAVASVGTASGHVSFSAEGHASRAAVTCLDVNLYLIDEHVKHSLPAALCTADILYEI